MTNKRKRNKKNKKTVKPPIKPTNLQFYLEHMEILRSQVRTLSAFGGGGLMQFVALDYHSQYLAPHGL